MSGGRKIRRAGNSNKGLHEMMVGGSYQFIDRIYSNQISTRIKTGDNIIYKGKFGRIISWTYNGKRELCIIWREGEGEPTIIDKEIYKSLEYHGSDGQED